MSKRTFLDVKRQTGTPNGSLFFKVKRQLESINPKAYDSVRRWFHKRILHRALLEIADRNGYVIQGGPFRGMRYFPELLSPENVGKYAIFPKILGSYEEELSSTLASMFAKGYDSIIKIGCAEGYYSVGIARELPHALIYAFDPDEESRRICQRLAEINDVAERVIIKGDFSIRELKTQAAGRTLVMCDCDRDTLDLLRPDLAPSLVGFDLILELYDQPDSSLQRKISERFAPTHEMLTLESRERERDPSAYPCLEPFSLYKQRLAVEEWRSSPPIWCVMTQRTDVGPRENLFGAPESLESSKL